MKSFPARWTSTTSGEFLTTLRINVLRRNGVVAEIAAEVTAVDAGVDAITIEERNAEASTLVIGVTVKSRSIWRGLCAVYAMSR